MLVSPIILLISNHFQTFLPDLKGGEGGGTNTGTTSKPGYSGLPKEILVPQCTHIIATHFLQRFVVPQTGQSKFTLFSEAGGSG